MALRTLDRVEHDGLPIPRVSSEGVAMRPDTLTHVFGVESLEYIESCMLSLFYLAQYSAMLDGALPVVVSDTYPSPTENGNRLVTLIGVMDSSLMLTITGSSIEERGQDV